MTIYNHGGHYGSDGFWVQTKRCFVNCGERCNCQPPLGAHYSRAHDTKPKPLTMKVWVGDKTESREFTELVPGWPIPVHDPNCEKVLWQITSDIPHIVRTK